LLHLASHCPAELGVPREGSRRSLPCGACGCGVFRSLIVIQPQFFQLPSQAFVGRLEFQSIVQQCAMPTCYLLALLPTFSCSFPPSCSQDAADRRIGGQTEMLNTFLYCSQFQFDLTAHGSAGPFCGIGNELDQVPSRSSWMFARLESLAAAELESCAS
jgi:hypothetical protein